MANAETHLSDPAWLLQSPISHCQQCLPALPLQSLLLSPFNPLPHMDSSLTKFPKATSCPATGSPHPYWFASPCLSPSDPPCCAPAQKANPFYEEWWFLVVIALVGLIFILLLVFVLIIRGQSKKYAKKSDSGERRGSGVW